MKNSKKKILKISIIIVLVQLILLLLTGRSQATSGWETVIDGLAGVLLLPTKFLILILGSLLNIIMGFFAGNSSLVGSVAVPSLSLQDILFNKVSLLDINFFDFSSSVNPTALTIRQNVAIWYASIRNIAAVVLALIAVYVGIRMALSTIAEDRAKYKTMLTDWLSSLALLFILQYIMIFTINVNNAFIDVLSKGTSGSTADIGEGFFTAAWQTGSFTTGMGCAIIYLLLQGITFIFLLTYIKRMITLAFLIVIAPLVTVTYSIDKMGDGKAQALNVWLKEYVYNILIQPFHCVSYLVLGQTALDLVAPSTLAGKFDGVGLANAVIAIAVIVFIYSAEKIVKHIFHFESESMGDTVANAAILGTVLGKFGNGSKRGGSAGVQGDKKMFGRNNNNGDNNKPTTKDPADGSNGKNPKNNNHPILGKAAKMAGKGLGAGLRQVSRVNAKALGAITLGTLGLSTGDPKAMIAGGFAGYGMGSDFAESRRTAYRKRQLAKAFNNYKAANPTLTSQQLIDNAMGFADGSVAATTDEAKELRSAMQQMQAQYIRNGLDEKKMLKQSRQLAKDIDDGYVSQYGMVSRFTGPLFEYIKNKKPRTK